MSESPKNTYGVQLDQANYLWLKEPAIFSDYCAVGVWSKAGVVRLAFCEWLADDVEPLVRSGIVMPISDAKALAERLLELIQEHETSKTSEEIAPQDG